VEVVIVAPQVPGDLQGNNFLFSFQFKQRTKSQ
jgi:hypothetical protein